MTTQQRAHLDVPASRRVTDVLPAIGAVAGIAGPLLFTVGFIAQGYVRRTEYSPIAETISALEAGPIGWIQQLNFVIFAVLMIIFGTGLRITLTHRRRIAFVIFVWWAAGLLAAAIFPLGETSEGETYDVTGLHQPNGFAFFLSTWAGLAVLSWCLRADYLWRSISRYALITSAVLALLFVILGAFAIPSSAPLHPWAGLLQRIYLAAWFPCLIALAVRLWRLVRGPSRTAPQINVISTG